MCSIKITPMNSSDPLSQLMQARDFLHAVEPNLPAYRHAGFSYVALLHNGERVILRARLALMVDASNSHHDSLTTANLSAGYIRLDIDATAAEIFIRHAVANDWLPVVRDQLLKLVPRAPPQYSDGYSAFHDHAEPPHSHITQDRLVLSGINRDLLVGTRSRELGRELQELGFNSIEELMKFYGLRGSEETTLEITADPVAAIHSSSKLDGFRVAIDFDLANRLDPVLFRLAVRNADPNVISTPITLKGDKVQWVEQAGRRKAVWAFDLTRSEIIDCRAVYAGNVQAALRLADLSALPNPLRNVIGLVDPNGSRLEKLLTEPGKKEGRDFEAAVAWLLQILGFASVHVGAMSGMSGEPDILARASPDIVLIVECTTGIPTDDKLTLLIARTAQMHESLRRSRQETASSEVLALFVTSRLPEEVVGMRRKAQMHSVVILCRPEIEQAVERSKFPPDPAAILRWWRELALTQFLTSERLSHLSDD
jgi:hypothetical protein